MNDYQTAIAELSLSGSIGLGRCSDSTVYRWARAINEILERERYEWRVKANCKEKALYVADI